MKLQKSKSFPAIRLENISLIFLMIAQAIAVLFTNYSSSVFREELAGGTSGEARLSLHLWFKSLPALCSGVATAAAELSRRGKAFTGFNMRCLGDGLCVASIM